MGRAPCCAKVGLHKGPWTPKEDTLLTKYVQAHGEGQWKSLPKKAGLLRCGKSCRLRWMNYLRPDIKRGNISPDEDDLIIRLHSLLGNRWSLIAGRLPGRTDNEIKNYWNSWIKKKIRKSNSNSAPSSITSTVNAPSTVDHHHPHFNYNSNQLDNYFTNQETITTKPETLFSSTCPLFMFDTSSLDHVTTTTTDTIHNARPEVLFHDTMMSLSSETWNMNHHHHHHQIQTLIPPHSAATGFTAAAAIHHDTSNYLPPLIENVENFVPIHHEVQSCNMDHEEGDVTLESLQRQELNEWVETQQQCPNFIFWESAEEEQVLPPNSSSSNMGITNSLSPFPSSYN